jgi:hypothetical protein
MAAARGTRHISFGELVERLEDAGLTVGLERHDGGLAITVVDPDGCRAIRLPVRGCFDRAATLLVLSGRLREAGGPTHAVGSWTATGTCVSGRWPELLTCWPELDPAAEAA